MLFITGGSNPAAVAFCASSKSRKICEGEVLRIIVTNTTWQFQSHMFLLLYMYWRRHGRNQGNCTRNCLSTSFIIKSETWAVEGSEGR